MLSRKTSRIILAIILAIFLMTSLLSFSWRAFGQPLDIQGELDKISGEEKSVLEKLFKTLQEIEGMEAEERRLSSEISALQAGTDRLGTIIAEKQEDYNSGLEAFRQVLLNYQSSGPASYLGIILKSKDLSSFLKSVNLIRDMSRNLKKLLKLLKADKEELTVQKEALIKDAAVISSKISQLKTALAKQQQLRDELEAYLDSLKEEKDFYIGRFEELRKEWASLMNVFPRMMDEYRKVIENDGIPLESLNLRLEFPYFRGSIYEQTMNDVLKNHPVLPDITFDFKSGKAVIEVPENRLVLSGVFIVEGQSVISYRAESGTFYDMPLEASSIRELFSGGSLKIDFEKYISGIKVNSISIREGYVDFTVTADLW